MSNPIAGPLIINDWLSIPEAELRFSFARSSGPGGQNVNKLNTKALLRWTVSESTALPDPIRRRLMARYSNRVNEAGELLITSERHREQARNVTDCLEKLRAMVLAVATPPKHRQKTKVPRRAKEKRLQNKKQTSQKKQNRRPPSSE